MKTVWHKAWRCGYERDRCRGAQKIAVYILTDKGIKSSRRHCTWDYHHYHYAHRGDCVFFNGDIEIDTGRLQTMVVENLSAEEQQKLQAVEDTMYDIEDEMKAAGLPVIKEAQVLYILALSNMPDSLILFQADRLLCRRSDG